MDKEEARALARRRLEELRQLPYEQLQEFMTHMHDETVGPSGITYQREVYAFWDGGRRAVDGDLRVSVAIDDGGWSAFSPLVEDFIISPTGEFVGE
jgi:hypothetical protein